MTANMKQRCCIRSCSAEFAPLPLPQALLFSLAWEQYVLKEQRRGKLPNL
jgi:hypothetical protein